MTTYTWSFSQFDTAPSEDGLTNVVKTIHWRLDAVDGEYSAGGYGTVGLDAPSPGSFVNYNNITEQWAIDAVSDKLDVTAVKTALDNQIEQQRNPPVVPTKPPFNAG